MGELKQGPISASGQFSGSEEKHLRLRVKQLICGSLKRNENQTLRAAAICTPGRDAGPLEAVAAGNWSVGIVEQSQGEGCC